MQIFGSTRLTQVSDVSLLLSGVCVAVVSLLLSGACVAVVIFYGSVCVCVVFVVSFCMSLLGVFSDVLVSVTMIFGKADFVFVSILFLTDSTSLASRTGVVVDVSCTCCCGDLVNSGFPFFPFVGVGYAIWGQKGFLRGQMSPANSGLILSGFLTRFS